MKAKEILRGRSHRPTFRVPSWGWYSLAACLLLAGMAVLGLGFGLVFLSLHQTVSSAVLGFTIIGAALIVFALMWSAFQQAADLGKHE